MKTMRLTLLAAMLCAVAMYPYASALAQTDDGKGDLTGWSPIRITPFNDTLTATGKYCAKAGDTVTDVSTKSNISCTADDILTDDKRNALKLSTVAAARLHSDRLLVQPATDAIKFTAAETPCSAFTVPTDHSTSGVAGTDFILYIAAAPMSTDRRGWGTSCGSASDRPVAGAVNIIPRYIANDTALTRLVAREMLVSLGFGLYTTTDKYTNIDIRGKTSVPTVTAPTALAKAKDHFNCTAVAGVELEYQDTTVLPYWKGRLLKDELMAMNQTAGYYTAITIGAMEDLGFYKGNYSNAEDMPWGRNAGCDFVTKVCVTDGTTAYPKMFCTNDDKSLSCTTDRLALGSCDIVTLPSDVPTYFHYFESATKGGALSSMDYCPVVTASRLMTHCSTTNSDMPGSVFGATSRCLDTTDTKLTYGGNAMNGVCADIQCDTTAKAYKVRVAGTSADYKDCAAGTTVTLASLGGDAATVGSVTCPEYVDVCSFPAVTPTIGSSQSKSSSSGASFVVNCMVCAAVYLATVLLMLL